MSKRIDAEGGLLNEPDAKDTAINVSAEPVTPQETTEQGGEDDTHEDDALEVVAMLPDDDRILVKIGDVGSAGTLGVLLEDHPSQVRVEETLSNGVWILFGISVSVVSSVLPGPPSDRTFYSTSSNGGQVDFEWCRGLV